MAQDLELDFEKYCVVDGSPKTVLLSPNHSKTEKKKIRKNPKYGNKIILTQNKEFTEINFNRYRSQSCRDARSTSQDVRSTFSGVNKSLKRGSVYQSSKEVSKISSKETECRQKIEFSRNSTPLPFEIFGSLCDLDEDDSLSNSRAFLENSINSIKIQENQESLSIPLNKSLSSRLELPHSPAKTPKNRFSPFKKMFDPFVKSKSLKSPLGFTTEKHYESTTFESKTLQKSLIHDFSYGDCDSCISSSCLNGVLKVENKNQMPYFEFSLKNDVLGAKTSKVGNGCNWVYNFHTFENRKKGIKDYNNKDLTKTIGKMRVSCYLCTELINTGVFDNSMVTEFVLHDVEGMNNCKSKKSTGQNFVEDLNLDLENTAIVIQFPSDKRERLNIENDESARVSVVIPSANHGLPCGESRGPSPLLDRWRLGGGCECGGWDVGCPLVVLNNLNVHKEEGCKQTVKLFLKGNKDNTPALTMKLTEEGQYAVDFHSQLTSLQAFSICVAILHSTETSNLVDHVKDREMLQCDSLRVFVEDEVKHLIETVVEEDKRKVKNEVPPSFLVNPPFSPMSRV